MDIHVTNTGHIDIHVTNTGHIDIHVTNTGHILNHRPLIAADFVTYQESLIHLVIV